MKAKSYQLAKLFQQHYHKSGTHIFIPLTFIVSVYGAVVSATTGVVKKDNMIRFVLVFLLLCVSGFALSIKAEAIKAEAIETGTIETGTIETGTIETGTIETGTIETEVNVKSSSLKSASDELKRLTEMTVSLEKERQQIAFHAKQVDQRLQTVKQSLDNIKMDYDRVKTIVDVAGQTDQVSRLLLRRRGFAVNNQYAGQDLSDYRKRINETMLRQLEINELLRESHDSASRIQAQYQAVLIDFSKSLSSYAVKLSELETATLEIKRVSQKYQHYLDEKLLWMPNTGAVPLTDLRLLVNGVLWLVHPDNIEAFLSDTASLFVRFPFQCLLWIILLSGLLVFREKLINQINAMARLTRKVRTDRYSATFAALFFTLLLALPVPIFLLGLAFLLERLSDLHSYTQTVISGFYYAGSVLMLLCVLRQLGRSQGLAEMHFRWSPELTHSLVKQSRWLRSILVPLVFVAGLSTGLVQHEEVVALGRLCFILSMLMVAMFIYKLWGYNSIYVKTALALPQKPKWLAFHLVWYPPLQALPWLLIVSALLGYYYTALYFSEKFFFTVASFLLLMILNGLLLRRFYMTQRFLKYQDAIKKREEALLIKEGQNPKSESESTVDQIPLEESALDCGALSEQAQKLLRVVYLVALFSAIWIVWKEAIPAFNIFNSIELPFTKYIYTDGQNTQVAVTLGDLLLSLLFAVLAILATKNLPGLLELSLLQYLPLSAPTRYAVKTLTQYVVALIGIVLACNTIGVEWSNIQWLVAALSVGLGFGLQEIVANFVSGIILLFEQPIRVGDIVTVNNVSGKVSRIRIRATTIINWERQEYIIPNKAFITGDLTNWTLTDTLNRLVITVGIAYGSDVNKAMHLIREAADEHEKVLTDPEPGVTFEEFGDNALILRLRAYLDEVEVRMQTLSELHVAINDKFAEAGIEIAFPQRDIHLNTTKPLELLLKTSTDVQSDKAG